MQFTIFQDSRRGARKVNQDRIAYTYGRDTLLLIVADGMGGHAGGEIAAQICVRLFIERFQREAKPVLQQPVQVPAGLDDARAPGAGLVREPVLDAGDAAHDLRRLRGAGRPRVLGARGRLAALPVPRGKLLAQTKDHSRVQYLVDQGIIGAGEVATHPDRNRIFSCLGGLVDPVIDLGKRTLLRDGDLIVACTDGLWGVLSREEIAAWLTSSPILQSAPQMMREAERRGGADGDNLSVIVVRWGPETLPEDEPSTTITETLGLGEFETQIDRTLTLTDRTGAAARPHRRRDRAGDRRDPGDDPPLPALNAPLRHSSGTPCASSSSTPRPRASYPQQGHRIIELAALEVVNRRATGRTVHFRVDPEREIDVGRDRGARDDLGRPQGQAEVRRRRRRVHRVRGGRAVDHPQRAVRPRLPRRRARARRPAALRGVHGGVVDTLALAREMFPGKRNNLDALCERFGIDNAQRTLHGALLDAQLLAEV